MRVLIQFTEVGAHENFFALTGVHWCKCERILTERSFFTKWAALNQQWAQLSAKLSWFPFVTVVFYEYEIKNLHCSLWNSFKKWSSENIWTYSMNWILYEFWGSIWNVVCNFEQKLHSFFPFRLGFMAQNLVFQNGFWFIEFVSYLKKRDGLIHKIPYKNPIYAKKLSIFLPFYV